MNVELTSFLINTPSSSAHAASATKSGRTIDPTIEIRLCCNGQEVVYLLTGFLVEPNEQASQ
jgi:hypothetical protein